MNDSKGNCKRQTMSIQQQQKKDQILKIVCLGRQQWW